MVTPAWLLLIWCGLGAATAAGTAAMLIGGIPAATWSLAPRPRNRLHGAAWSIGCGMLLYPIVYGFLFEVLQRADIGIGILLGFAHGLLLFITTRRHTPTRPALRVGAAHLVYGAVLAFLYVTP